MDILGRYYTQDLFSNLLVNQFSSVSPSKILDLGIGEGSLMKAASARWAKASFYAADIDKSSVSIINKQLPFIKIITADSLNKNIDKKLELKVGSVDIAVCNPPYLKLDYQKKFNNLFTEANLQNCINLKKVTSDVIFLAQNLRLLKKSGELGIILPDSILTGHDFQILRQSIISNHFIKGVIELPENIFPKTEARTHILLLEKGFSTYQKVPLYISDKKGQCYDQIEVSTDLLFQRMDFTFHKWNQKRKTKKNIKSLNEIGAKIQRGNQTHAQLKLYNKPYLHTTNLIHDQTLRFKNSIKHKNLKIILAEKNDILLARVGRGCVGKTSIIKSGIIPISDCIYRIRVPEDYVIKVWNSLISNSGKAWLKANSHGVCAKVISKKDLLNFPVSL